jgi:predicted ATPase
MTNYIKRLEVVSLHNRFDITQDFTPNTQIIFGENGTGKTTLLHILANLLNADYRRFFEIDFNHIKATMDDGTTLEIRKADYTPETNTYNSLIIKSSKARSRLSIPRFTVSTLRERQENEYELQRWYRRGYGSLLPVAYFPAFRTIIEAWAATEVGKSNYRQDENREDKITEFVRNVYGQFTPQINYPSPLEIEQGLVREMQEATARVTENDRLVLAESFTDVFSQLSPSTSSVNNSLKKPHEIIHKIKELSQEINNYPLQKESVLGGIYLKLQSILQDVEESGKYELKLAAEVLSVYQDSLEKMVATRKQSFANIKKYLNAVNYFLSGKELIVDIESQGFNEVFVGLKLDDGSLLKGFSALSSGERQIVTLIYAATRMNKQKLILIDEPEISLHVDWQRELLKKISEQSSNSQIIVCTHSPVIAGDYDEYMTEINLNPTNRELWIDDSTDRDEFPYLEDEDDVIDSDEFPDIDE